ncbi:glycerophosphocholine phosphodiesterase GPCPD1-like [Eurosta solidaginis]|uniref:glycerophosphocholine phosphodiesterase GPCPD1-like n=1 Tax=Eurosta solidaginis TaxID=178769 RepID=UPI0035315BCE
MCNPQGPVGNLLLTVEMVGARIAPYELVGVMGNQKSLGKWSIQEAPLLTRSEEDYNVWTTNLTLPLHKWIRYRYFIGVQDKKTQIVQVRRWEVAERARELRLTRTTNECNDRFGFICPSKPKLRRAWLNIGSIVLFKLFYEALEFSNSRDQIIEEGEVIKLKIEPVDPESLQPIMSSARAQTQYTKMMYGNSQLKEQPDYGVEYKFSTLIFQTILLDRLNVGYLVKIFAFNKLTECVHLVAQSYLPPDAVEGSEGVLEVRLLKPDETELAVLAMQYLVINPAPDWQVKLNVTCMQYWPARWKGLSIGHRGMGRSFVINNPADTLENTVASMKQAFKLGADMVEFDVMLTKDKIPIVYHDFHINICPNSETPTEQCSIKSVPIASLTYDELQSTKTYFTIGDNTIEYPAPNKVENEDERLFPTLKDFFKKTHKMLGFNIEVKWPQDLYEGGAECLQHIDKNQYVDAILDVVKRFSWGRMCFFSSYDADICIMLRYKQNIYPVLLLISDKSVEFVDPRTHCLHPAVNTAQAFDLNGIVMNVNMLRKHPDALTVANRQNKWVMLWGDPLSDRATNYWCASQGYNALIFDHMDLILANDKRNIFEIDEKLQKLFELQQSCGCR